jgi:hypothetical protein
VQIGKRGHHRDSPHGNTRLPPSERRPAARPCSAGSGPNHPLTDGA